MAEVRIENFWDYVDVAAKEECWMWTGGKTGKMGYGRFSRGRRKVVAHRVSYRLHYGEIPPGLCVLHQCDTPACVNPNHLFLGTKADNNRDMILKGRMRRGRDRPESKLTEARVVAIRAEYQTGTTMLVLGAKYGVSERTISDAIQRNTWRHVV